MKNIVILITLCLLPFGCKDNNTDEEDCADCPCPEWVEKELNYYKEMTPLRIGYLSYTEKNGVPYYMIEDMFSSLINPRFFDSEGTEIGKDHEDFNTLWALFIEGEFRYNYPCTRKYNDK
jgi:hypothetical protein